MGMPNGSNDVPAGTDEPKPARAAPETALEGAFADARRELGKRLGALQRVYPKGVASGAGTPAMWGGHPWLDWYAVAAEAAKVAEKLAKEYGKAIAPVVKDRTDWHSMLLAFPTLDRLGLHDDAAQTALRLMRPKYDVGKHCNVLAWVAFCSTATRGAVADALAHKLSYPPEEFARYFDLDRDYRYMLSIFTDKVLEFIAITGDARTIELLEEAARSADHDLAQKIGDTAKSIRARLCAAGTAEVQTRPRRVAFLAGTRV